MFQIIIFIFPEILFVNLYGLILILFQNLSAKYTKKPQSENYPGLYNLRKNVNLQVKATFVSFSFTKSTHRSNLLLAYPLPPFPMCL